jgi:hypothetical protein
MKHEELERIENQLKEVQARRDADASIQAEAQSINKLMAEPRCQVCRDTGRAKAEKTGWQNCWNCDIWRAKHTGIKYKDGSVTKPGAWNRVRPEEAVWSQPLVWSDLYKTFSERIFTPDDMPREFTVTLSTEKPEPAEAGPDSWQEASFASKLLEHNEHNDIFDASWGIEGIRELSDEWATFKASGSTDVAVILAIVAQAATEGWADKLALAAIETIEKIQRDAERLAAETVRRGY